MFILSLVSFAKSLTFENKKNLLGGCPRATFQFRNKTTLSTYNFVDSTIGNMGSLEACPCMFFKIHQYLIRMISFVFRYRSSLCLSSLLFKFFMGTRTLFQRLFRTNKPNKKDATQRKSLSKSLNRTSR